MDNIRFEMRAGDRILSLYGDTIYEARIIDTRKRTGDDSEDQYLVHYMGWNKK